METRRYLVGTADGGGYGRLSLRGVGDGMMCAMGGPGSSFSFFPFLFFFGTGQRLGMEEQQN